MSKSSVRQLPSSSRTSPGWASGVSTTWAETTFIPLVIVQTWRSCTSATPLAPEDVAADLGEIDAARGRLEQDVDAVAQQPERARDDEDADRDRGDGVGLRPAGRLDDESRDQHRGRAEQVPGDLEVDRPHVEARLTAFGQEAQRDGVPRQGEGGHHDDDAGRDLRRRDEPTHPLDDDDDRQREEDDRVDGRRDDLDPVPAERPARRPRPPGDPDGGQRQGHPGYVGEQVTGVGQEGQRVAGDPGHQLDQEDRQADAHGGGDPAPALTRRAQRVDHAGRLPRRRDRTRVRAPLGVPRSAPGGTLNTGRSYGGRRRPPDVPPSARAAP